MRARNISLGTIVLITLLYWGVLASAWQLYNRRGGLAARQAADRDAAAMEIREGPGVGQQLITYEGTVHLTRVVLLVVGPPVLLLGGWLIARRQA